VNPYRGVFSRAGLELSAPNAHMLTVFTSEASMADFDSKIRESQEQVAKAQTKISEITSRIETARAKIEAGEAAIDVENATLDDVHQHTDLMNANIADLIMGLDDVTAGFSRDFDEMRNKTGMESFIGIFSNAKSESMRQERMRSASIEDKLQDLIGKSDIIVKLLQGQLDMLNAQKTSVENNLTATLDEREATVGSLEAVRAEISAMDPAIIELENKISVEQDAAKRTKLESELAALNTRYNALVQQEQVDLAKSQTLERYIEKGKTWMDSLQNQAATQMVLINKLQTDTKQRVVLYDALTSSLKTAQQQDVAHRINEIGVKTDQEAQAAMAAIGTATNNRMADMMEAHEDHMVFARKVLEAKAKADERFARRFASIVEKHDKNQYGG
jgi:peptidoglycan hydrolase CwlO-like protein